MAVSLVYLVLIRSVNTALVSTKGCHMWSHRNACVMSLSCFDQIRQHCASFCEGVPHVITQEWLCHELIFFWSNLSALCYFPRGGATCDHTGMTVSWVCLVLIRSVSTALVSVKGWRMSSSWSGCRCSAVRSCRCLYLVQQYPLTSQTFGVTQTIQVWFE